MSEDDLLELLHRRICSSEVWDNRQFEPDALMDFLNESQDAATEGLGSPKLGGHHGNELEYESYADQEKEDEEIEKIDLASRKFFR